ncbi:FAD-binding oxidoreductase [Nocardiopsis sp. NPDC050513]|uniref:FAD-binding oxidoreductase n=1 Tax=Nocardiopsis sp. NPDC050513 TaxID=3364338 RepID=UPI003788DB61
MTNTSISAPARELARRVRGPVLLPGQDGYAQELAGFNRAVHHRPDVVVGATGPDDVRAAVGFAARHGLRVAVQATGHGATSPVDTGVLVSTRRMDEVTVDPRTRTARVGAGARWQQVIERAAQHGLAPLNGSSPLVGAVSYTLGGGLPVLGRTFGWAADRVRSLDVVTAGHGPVTAAPDRHTDLFWALRGGKTGFGVVTAMEVGLVPLTGLQGGGLYFPAERAERVLRAWREWTSAVPETMNTSVALLRLPDAPGVPEPLRGRPVVHVRVAHIGSPGSADALLRPLRRLGPRLLDTVARIATTSIASVHDDPTEPMPYDERSLMLRSLDGDAVDALLHAAGPDSATGMAMVEIRRLGGALSRPPRPGGPFDAITHRNAAYSLSTVSPVPGPRATGPAEATALLDRMAPWSTGRRLVNFLGGPDSAALAPQAYSPEVSARLAEVKRAYDPDRLFPAAHLSGGDR